MRFRLFSLWESLHTTYWFIPSLMVAVAIVLSFITLELDQSSPQDPLNLPWIYAGEPDGARALLSTVAGSLISVASVTFSITIVALTLASSQFGPRMLYTFMRDTGNQIVLGTFVATFIYCLLILRTIRSSEDLSFVPQLSVTVAVILTIISLGVLIYFIHHVSISIQANHVVASVGKDLNQAIERLFPGRKPTSPFEDSLRDEADVPEQFEEEAVPISATENGYLQMVDYDGLLELATEYDLILSLNSRPGNFVSEGTTLMMVWPGKHLNEEVKEEIAATAVIGLQRKRIQDVEFGINQLVEVAVRALSPAINDPFTAMASIDQLAVALAQLARKDLPSSYRYDRGGDLRLIVNTVTFAGLVSSAFNQIRHQARSNVAVSIRLLKAIAIVATHTTEPDQRVVLAQHAQLIWRGSIEVAPEEVDRKAIERHYQIAMRSLRQQELGLPPNGLLVSQELQDYY